MVRKSLLVDFHIFLCGYKERLKNRATDLLWWFDLLLQHFDGVD